MTLKSPWFSVVLINSHEAGRQDAGVVRSGETAGREKMEAPGPSVPERGVRRASLTPFSSS